MSENDTHPKESNLIWFAVLLIAGTGLLIWLANSFAAEKEGLPDDALVRKTVRGQFEAFFDMDKDKFLSFYSKEYNNGEYTYDDKIEQLKDLSNLNLEVKDFRIEFLETGRDEKVDVHIDLGRNFASTYVYTYWRQRGGDNITIKPVQQMAAFLLRREGKHWRIISDASIVLKQREDAEHLILTGQFKPYMDPSTYAWPPPEKEQETAKMKTAPVQEEEENDINEDAGSEANN